MDEDFPLHPHSDMRQCRECQIEQPIGNFMIKRCLKRGKSYHIGTCRSCIAAEQRWRWRNKVTRAQKLEKLDRQKQLYAARKLEGSPNAQ